MSVKRFRKTCAVCAAAAGPLLLAGGPAVAAPLDFGPDPKLTATCYLADLEVKGIIGAVPVAGNGAWTPYTMNNGQTFVPSSFEVTAGEGLKSRHLVNDQVAKGKTGPVRCVISGVAFNDEGELVDFTALVTGKLVGKAR